MDKILNESSSGRAVVKYIRQFGLLSEHHRCEMVNILVVYLIDHHGTLLDKAKLEGGPSSVPHLSPQTTRGRAGNHGNENLPSRWALKKHPKRVRFSEKQKTYLLQNYNLDEESGRKLEAGDV